MPADDCANRNAEAACNDDAVGLQSRLTFAVEADTRYFVFVDGYGNGQGDYDLTVHDGPCR